MTLYPDILAKAQAEIDTVIGLTRLPMLSDRTQLPYINAIILEVYRHGQVIPRSIPHKLREDDVHEGYFIPKDSTVIANLWCVYCDNMFNISKKADFFNRGMARDSRQYRNPDAFDPSRFMGDKPELDPRSYVFGFGRRICPGKYICLYMHMENSFGLL
jgi:cytochrome P450